MTLKTHVLLKLKNREGKVFNSLYYFKWGAADTMYAHFMYFILKNIYIKNESSANYDFFKAHKFTGNDISCELKKEYIELDFDIFDLKVIKNILNEITNEHGFLIIEILQNKEKNSHPKITVGALLGSEDILTKSLKFQTFVSPREYMEGWEYLCEDSFIKSFELFCEAFKISILPATSPVEETKGDE